MDVLSDVLKTVRLRSEIHLCPELAAPWGIELAAQPECAVFYVLSRGSCYLEVEGVPGQAAMVGGDLAMLPHGTPHTLRDRPDTPAVPLAKLFPSGCDTRRPAAAPGETEGPESALVVGQFRFENRTAGRFLGSLPPLVHIRSETTQGVPWLAPTLRFLAFECTTEAPGAQIAIARLSDVLFIQILRAFIAQESRAGRTCEQHSGMLRALMDPDISKCLALIHQRPEHPWTVAELAERVHLSRTAFAVRFRQLAGVAPLEYLTQWRMQKAGELLGRGDDSLDAIAANVGYDSVAAFSRAFKREMGVPPGLFRKERAGISAPGGGA